MGFDGRGGAPAPPDPVGGGVESSGGPRLRGANPQPTPEEVRKGMAGNLCRCGTYVNIFAAVERAAQLRRGAGGDS